MAVLHDTRRTFQIDQIVNLQRRRVHLLLDAAGHIALGVSHVASRLTPTAVAVTTADCSGRATRRSQRIRVEVDKSNTDRRGV